MRGLGSVPFRDSVGKEPNQIVKDVFLFHDYTGIRLPRLPPPLLPLYYRRSENGPLYGLQQRIYDTSQKHVSPDDIHVDSTDEVFMDVTNYLKKGQMSAAEFTRRITQEVLRETCITAAAGIGSDLYFSKIAMDIVAKHIPADRDGVRIAELDEMSYRRLAEARSKRWR